jgi:hypothetical protein
MTNMAISRAMAKTLMVPIIGYLLSPGRTIPERPGEKAL